MLGRCVAVFVAACCILFLPLPAHPAPITFNTALPVSKGEGIFRAQAKYSLSTGDPASRGRELAVWSVPLVLVYGVTRDFTLFAVTEYVDRELEEGGLKRGDEGLGDSTFIARYTVWTKDLSGETLRLAPFAAIKAPTGRDDATDSQGTLPRNLQPGTGSWDYTAGTIFTWQTLKRQVDASASYTLNTEAGGFRFGDVARLDASYQHRLFPKKLGPGLPAFVYGVVESSLVWQDKSEIDGVDDADSGGVKLFVTPGIQYVTLRTVTEAAVSVPVFQDLNGNALEDDYAAILSFRVNF
ncbi:MAG TPA: transporter [Deltaproteobacteria bacterium]|nr:MAG: hypothetical protein A2Z79_07685 [Deltaproteobacteria bacterium GWA2_55_82]OGQ65113.1 MAG: hypothetical protein A3I81_07105 [Deltaproteobacteria bacterium RIFCSPLOWO2_02_FULL_55_12]OIJ74761.1 MAG: hypothetical protein A2V21_311100 [Deltaproteobacteria bacterium GWC2_55_46]HBG45689.1 transporter [Deltaproteobacteria bacterium]HCY12118.1 transporter [Deltaproteobacteria bacterium]